MKADRRRATAILIGAAAIAAWPRAATRADEVEAGILKGRALDAQGRPLAGVEVFARNQYLENWNLQGVTDADGRYRIDTSRPVGTYHASALIRRDYRGTRYVFSLEQRPDELFAGNEGALRDFVWHLSGPRPDGDYYGSPVIYYVDLDDFSVEEEAVVLTLEPLGPLVDGSDGTLIERNGERTPDGFAVTDVPVGHYRITARYEPPDAAPQPLQLRLRDEGEYADTLDADFVPLMDGIQQIVLEVRLRR